MDGVFALHARELYPRIRSATEQLCAPLTVEDMTVQSLPEASPLRWHLAHTSWFFEQFVLAKRPGHRPVDARWAYLFNSYYEAIGARTSQAERGQLSRPTVDEVRAYRRQVDVAMMAFICEGSDRELERAAFVLELGLNHEEQHQELMLTDVKHALGSNPLDPPYVAGLAPAGSRAVVPLRWLGCDGGSVEIGARGATFAFDNERARHRVHLEPFELSSRLVTCGEWQAFMADRGYDRSELWLSDGWLARTRFGWRAPLYWRDDDTLFTLGGRRAIDPAEPVCHISFYEADAYARWARARLPTEAEWETVAMPRTPDGNLLESGRLHPTAAHEGEPQLFGDVWEWTASPYVAYPRFREFDGALGEYNGKFMSGRMVLRGGSCVTPRRHLRASYRNFFVPETRWQFSGLRLARSHG
jgi:ergothioneine biosynthesis protein EgtB